METLKDLDPKGQRRTLLIECSLLLEPGHIYGRIASALLNLSRVASIKYCTTKGFLELCEELRLEEQLLVILKDADRLLRDDPMILWTLLHLRRLLIKPPHIQFLLSSGMQFEEFIPVFDGVIPVIVRSTTPKMIDIIGILLSFPPYDLICM